MAKKLPIFANDAMRGGVPVDKLQSLQVAAEYTQEPVTFDFCTWGTVGATAQKQHRIAGYEVIGLVEGSSPGVGVRVRFAAPGGGGEGILLRPGGRIRIDRGFKNFWTNWDTFGSYASSAEVEQYLRLAVVRDPLVRFVEPELDTVLGADIAAGVGAPSTCIEGFSLPHGSGRVTVHLLTDATTRLAATHTVEVWWFIANPRAANVFGSAMGMWAHNAADDFTTAGRGPATAAHDAEAFEKPAGATRLYLSITSGTALHCRVATSGFGLVSR